MNVTWPEKNVKAATLVLEHTLWRLLRSHVAIACPRHRDAAPLRLVSWMSCEPPAHIEALLRQLMLLFAEVQPVASEQVVSAARRALDLPEKPQVSWDEIRDAIINGLVVGGNSSPPPEVTGLLSGFLRRFPLPRLVHFLDMILPQVPVKSPCRTSARRFSSGYLMEEKSEQLLCCWPTLQGLPSALVQSWCGSRVHRLEPATSATASHTAAG